MTQTDHAGKQWGAWLSEQLAARSWRQADLIEAADNNLARQSVSKWLLGQNTADPTAAITVALALGTDPAETLRAAGYELLANVMAGEQQRHVKPLDDRIVAILERAELSADEKANAIEFYERHIRAIRRSRTPDGGQRG